MFKSQNLIRFFSTTPLLYVFDLVNLGGWGADTVSMGFSVGDSRDGGTEKSLRLQLCFLVSALGCHCFGFLFLSMSARQSGPNCKEQKTSAWQQYSDKVQLSEERVFKTHFSFTNMERNVRSKAVWQLDYKFYWDVTLKNSSQYKCILCKWGKLETGC